MAKATARSRRDEECDNEAQPDVAAICREVQSLQRQRRGAMKLRVMLENGTTSFVASMIGYSNTNDEAERKKTWEQARKQVKAIDNGDAVTVDNGVAIVPIVEISKLPRHAFASYEESLTKEMVELCKKLPVAPWFDHPDRRGIKLTMLATIIGEAGDLYNYPNPAKLWKRLFGAPYTKKGETKMPSHWRVSGGLTADEWQEIGYSPRRNASLFQLRENIVMQNRTGPYRKRYDEAKANSKKNPDHAEWSDGRHHSHAQLLAAKRFVLDLWNHWHNKEKVDGRRQPEPA